MTKSTKQRDARSGNPPIDLRAMALSYPARLFAYGVVAFAVCQLVFIAVREHGIGFAAQENGPVEQAQVWMALFASACLFYAASQMRSGRAGLVVCACMAGYAAARESDTWFETVFFDDAYKYLVGLPLFCLAISEMIRGRESLLRDAISLARSPSITIFAIAGIYICSICQVLDRPDFWASLGEGPALEISRAAIEEFAELFGYLLLAFSGVESVALAYSTCQCKVNDNAVDCVILELA